VRVHARHGRTVSASATVVRPGRGAHIPTLSNPTEEVTMVSLLSLWLPILVSAVAVFLASSVIHMVLRYHRTDVGRLPAEDQTLAAIRTAGTVPGEYVLPYATMAEMNSPEFIQKRSAGPVAVMTVLPGGPPAMGRNLAAWFVYALVVNLTAGYIASRALGAGPADYMDVFRFVGTTAFAGYGFGIWQQTIWWGRPWTTTLKSTFDALIYALLTAGIFGWLWPGGTA
jgi:hypothetical protein